MAKLIELTKVLDWKKLLKEVQEEEEEYIIKKGKKPVVVVMPFDNYKNLSRLQEESRKRLFEIIERVEERNKDVPPEEVEKDVAEAIKAVRKEEESMGKIFGLIERNWEKNKNIPLKEIQAVVKEAQEAARKAKR